MSAPTTLEPTRASSAAYRMVREHWAKKQPLLPVDRDLARAIRKDRPLHLSYIARLQAGEPVDRILLAANKPGILAVIRRYRAWETEWSDLVQEAKIAAIEGLLRFDPTRGSSPLGWLQTYVRSYVRRYLQNEGSIVRLPAHRYDAGYGAKVQALRPNYVPFSDFDNSNPEIGAGAAVPSFQDSIRDETDTEGEISIEDLRARMPEVVWHLTRALTVREREIAHRRFMRDEEQTLQEIGAAFELTRERIRQIEGIILAKLRTAAMRRGAAVENFATFEAWLVAIADRIASDTSKEAA